MPTHKIHLAIAKKVNEDLKLNLDSIMLGSVLPDLANNDHAISHYQEEGTYESELANPDMFVKEYRNELDNPIMIGYLIHLLTDRFYNDYYFKNHCIFNNNGIPVSVKLLNGKVIDKIKVPKHADFYKYDKWLLKNNFVENFSSDECINHVHDLSVASFNNDKLKKYINNCNNDKPRYLKTSLFYKSLTKKELDLIFNDCIKYTKDYFKKNNIMN